MNFEYLNAFAWIACFAVIYFCIIKKFKSAAKDLENTLRESGVNFFHAGSNLAKKPSYPLFKGRPIPDLYQRQLDAIYDVAVKETVDWNKKFPKWSID
jgi:hypothetical protein